MKKTTRQLIYFILDHPWVIISGIIFVTLVMFGFAIRIHFDFTIEHLFAKGDPAIERYFEFRDEFKREDNLILLMYETDDPFSTGNLRKNRRIIHLLENIEGIDKVTGLTNVELFTAGGEYLLGPAYDVIPVTQDSLDKIKKRLTSSKLMEDLLISKKGNLASIIIELDDDYNSHSHRAGILAEIDSIQSTVSWTWYQAGVPVLRTRYVQYMIADNIYFVIPVIIMIVIFLSIVFRSWEGVLLPLLIVLMTDIWTLGLMVIIGVEINIITYLIPTLLLITGVGDSVHFLVKYYRTLLDIKERRLALYDTIKKIGTAIFLTSFTTAVGFGALSTANIIIVKQFGMVVAIGVFIAFTISILFLPAMLMILKPTPSEKLTKYSRGFRVRFMNIVTAFVRNYPKTIIVSGFIVVIIGLFGGLKLNHHSSLMADLRPGNKVYDDMHVAEEKMGSILPLELVIDVSEAQESKFEDIQDPELLILVDKLQSFIKTIPEVGKVVSIVDFIKEINQAMHEGDRDQYRLPLERSTIAQYFLLYEGEFASLINFDYTKLRISAHIKDITSKRSQEIVKQIQIYIDEHFPPQVGVEITGTTLLALKTNNYLVQNLTNSFLIAIGVITVVMILLFKSVKIALISLIPNIIPMIIMAAIMGYFDIPLRPPTAMTFAIAFGIAVDDTLHYLIRYRMELSQSNWHYRQANDATLQSTGVAMLSTTAILVAGFSILSLSNFLPTIQFGLLSSITIFAALLGDLIFLPALLSQLKPEIIEKN